MWPPGWRQEAWGRLAGPWDLIIIGGGITGAGLFREAARNGLRTLLLESRDFASGTSSRSSKLVHGGLRYLRSAQLRLTAISVHEREHLLREARGLVNPLGFFFPSYRDDPLPGWIFGLGLAVYDLLALKWGHRHYDPAGLLERVPFLRAEGLRGGYRYFDAWTDDARLVLRLIRTAVAEGCLALNYAPVVDLLRDRAGRVRGVALQDAADPAGRTLEVKGRVVVNAAGPWADTLRRALGLKGRLRLLRGGHLVFPLQRLPLTRAVSFLHPQDGRPVFAVPWEGVVLLGTTDVDQGPLAEPDPAISPAEARYLLQAARHAFPDLDLGPTDVLATYAGIRPVIGHGSRDPSREPREHAIWRECGLLTVTGGKMTTFRIMAHDALRALRRQLPQRPRLDRRQPLFGDAPAVAPELASLDPPFRLRLLGRYGPEAAELWRTAPRQSWEAVPGTPYRWAELYWACAAEGVVHLEDLALRRVRLGLLAPDGGAALLQSARPLLRRALGWDEARWQEELGAYRRLWARAYAAPDFSA